MKNITKEDFLEALSKSLNKTQLMRNLGYKGGYRISQIKDWEREFNINIDNIIRQNIEQYNKEHIIHYRCKHCGKEFTEKYSKTSSGEFCSRKCANIYTSNFNKKSRIDKIKLSSKGKKYIKGAIINLEEEYYKNPKFCPICGNIIPYEIKKHKTCSPICGMKLRVKNRSYENCGGYRINSNRSHHGYYKGIYCDSTFELAYLIYCLDHNIDIKRCDESFDYEYEGKNHKYHPDFVVNGEIIEIKNYYREINDIKLNAVNKPIKILYYDDLIPIFDYVAQTYGKKYTRSNNNFYELYEKSS